MARGMIQMLTDAMRSTVRKGIWFSEAPRRITLKRVLAKFWDELLPWTPEAERDLQFWEGTDFASLRSPISADTLEVWTSNVLVDPSSFMVDDIKFMASDASDTACGGGTLYPGVGGGFHFDPAEVFYSELTVGLAKASSVLREITAIWWMLQSLCSKQCTCGILLVCLPRE